MTASEIVIEGGAQWVWPTGLVGRRLEVPGVVDGAREEDGATFRKPVDKPVVLETLSSSPRSGLPLRPAAARARQITASGAGSCDKMTEHI